MIQLCKQEEHFWWLKIRSESTDIDDRGRAREGRRDKKSIFVAKSISNPLWELFCFSFKAQTSLIIINCKHSQSFPKIFEYFLLDELICNSNFCCLSIKPFSVKENRKLRLLFGTLVTKQLAGNFGWS